MPGAIKISVAIIWGLIVCGIATGHKMTRDDNGLSAVLPYMGAVKFIDHDLYRPSNNYTAIFTDSVWYEIMGVWSGLITSSGVQSYKELRFLNRSRCAMEWGFIPHIRAPRKGKGHHKKSETYRFDEENLLLSFSAGNENEVYSIEYFTADDAEKVNYREIIGLRVTAGTGPPITFIR